MIIYDVAQRSDEWFLIRGTVPTASRFDKILTATGKHSEQADRYANELVANWMMGPHEVEREELKSSWVDRGVEMEDEARLFYELKSDNLVSQVGFIMHDSGKFGCSPDGLIEGGGLEIKCPAHFTHVDYLLKDKLPTKYFVQIQGSMLITGAQWWDFISYHPAMDPLMLRIPRDEGFMDALTVALFEFTEKLETKKDKLTRLGYAA